MANILAGDASYCNAEAFEERIAAGTPVHLDAGKYFFHRPLDTVVLSNNPWLIQGPKPAHHQSLVDAKWDNSGDAVLIPLDSRIGDVFIKANAPSSQRPYGTWQLRNLAIAIGVPWRPADIDQGAAVHFGDFSDTSTAGAHNRGNVLEGVTITANKQLYTASNSLLVGPDYELREGVNREPLVKLWKQYDLKLDLCVRGGWVGCELVQADAPDIRLMRTSLNGIGFLGRSLEPRGSVTGVCNFLYGEGAQFCNAYWDSLHVQSGRLENGYHQHESFWNGKQDNSWLPTAGTLAATKGGSSLVFVPNINGKAASNYFVAKTPIRVQAPGDKAREYIVDFVSGDTIGIENGLHQSYINHDFGGASVERCLGHNFTMRGGRSGHGMLAVGYNVARQGLPQGVYVPSEGRMASGSVQLTSGHHNESNRCIFVACHVGGTFKLQGGLDHFGDHGPYHPMVRNAGHSRYSNVSSGYSINASASIRNKLWNITPLSGVTGWWNHGLLIDWLEDEDGRIVEDWKYCSSGRQVHLDGLKTNGPVTLDYAFELRTTDGTTKEAKVEVYSPASGDREEVATATIGPTWTTISGQLTKDYGSESDPALWLTPGGNVRFSGGTVERV